MYRLVPTNIRCDRCNGTGMTKYGTKCPQCLGHGVALQFEWTVDARNETDSQEVGTDRLVEAEDTQE